MTSNSLELTTHHYTKNLYPSIRTLLLEIYSEVYSAEIQSDPFFSVEEFGNRLAGHASSPGWWCVVGYVDNEPVGYAYGSPVRRGGWWNGPQKPLDPKLTEETGRRTFGLFEIMVRTPWRKTGIARTIHDDLVSQRPEERAALFVEKAHPRVRELYESWGYRYVADMRPSSQAPLYAAMLLQLR